VGVLLEGGEEMDVVGHDDVASDEDVVGNGGFGKETEGLMKRKVGEDGYSVVGTEGEKVEKVVGMNSI
jgi:hypothetical protein